MCSDVFKRNFFVASHNASVNWRCIFLGLTSAFCYSPAHSVAIPRYLIFWMVLFTVCLFHALSAFSLRALIKRSNLVMCYKTCCVFVRIKLIPKFVIWDEAISGKLSYLTRLVHCIELSLFCMKDWRKEKNTRMAASSKACSNSCPSDDDFEDESRDELTAQFEAASVHLRALTDRTDSSTLLYLYGRYKQASEGPCTVSKPGLLDFRGRQKWEAWKALKQLDKTQAMVEYVKKIEELDPDWCWTRKSGAKGNPGGFGVGVSRMMLDEGDSGPSGKDWLDSVKEGDLNLLKVLWNADRSLVNRRDEMGMTPLHWASDRGHLDVVEWLIRQTGADANAKDITGQTPLHFAYACGHDDIVSALLAAGADETLVDDDGNRPRDLKDCS